MNVGMAGDSGAKEVEEQEFKSLIDLYCYFLWVLSLILGNVSELPPYEVLLAVKNKRKG